LNGISIEKVAHLASEEIQIFLRIFLIVCVLLTLILLDSNYLNIEGIFHITVLEIFIAVLCMNVLYYIFLKYYPYQFQTLRIAIVAVLDVVASAYIMYLVGEISLYYTVLFLWYMIGYGLRYGKDIAYITYATILVSWVVLIHTSEFWINNSSFAYSWFITYAVLPLYYLQIVNKLKLNLLELHKDIETSHYQASHDHLTNLPNRVSFEKKLNDLQKEKKKFALLFIDLDKFKSINDEHGHHIGDKVLKQFAKKMDQIFPYTARLGGDEFIAIVDYEDEKNLKKYLEQVLKNISIRCQENGQLLSASIGISLFPKDSQNMHILKKKADKAMYEAKKRGKNTYVLYGKMKKES
jgi:diguanylate cyclase (GGDEF)-like protein